MNKRTIEELNIIDDFLFLEMINYGEEGKEFCRLLLSTILGRPIGEVKITAQKVMTPGSTTQHGVRLDVCIEEIACENGNTDGNAGESKNTCENRDTRENRNTINAEVTNHIQDIYDVEMENRKSTEIKKSLPKRSRYYHSMIDRNLMWYTAKTQIVEDVTIPYDDGSTTIYLYTRGVMEKDKKELAELLHYIQDSKEDNVSNPTVAKVHRFTEQVKKDKEVGIGYMKTIEYENFIREEGFELGEKHGEKRGIELGEKRGIMQGYIQACQKIKLSREETLQNIIEEYQLTDASAKEILNKYWK